MKVRVRIVTLVYKEGFRNSCVCCIFPCKLCSDLDAGFSVYDDKCAACNSCRLKNISDKVKVAGSVDYIELLSLPADRSDRVLYGYSSLYFLGIIIAYGVSVLGLSEAVCCLCKIQHCLRQ